MGKTVFVEGGRIEFLDERFYVAGHDPDGNPIFYPSVTSILDMYPKGPQFEEWLKGVGFNAKEIAGKAADSGSRVHNAVSQIVNGVEPDWIDATYNEEEWRGILGFCDLCNRFKPKFIGNEITVISHKHHYAGTLDLVFYLNNELWLCDVKFSGDVYDTAWLQLAAYKKAWDEAHSDLQIEKMGILHLRARTRTEGKGDAIQGVGWKMEMPPHPANKLFEMFMHIHAIYYYKNPKPEPKNYSMPSRASIPKECLIVSNEEGKSEQKVRGRS